LHSESKLEYGKMLVDLTMFVVLCIVISDLLSTNVDNCHSVLTRREMLSWSEGLSAQLFLEFPQSGSKQIRMAGFERP